MAKHVFTTAVVLAVCGLIEVAGAQQAQPGQSVPRVEPAAPAAQPAQPNDPQADKLLAEQQQIREVRWERAKVAINDALRRASLQVAKPNDELSTDDFREAKRIVREADHILASNMDVAKPDQARDLQQQIVAKLAALDTQQQKWEADRVEQGAKAAREAEAERVRQEAQRRARRISELKNQISAASQERDYEAMITLLNQVLKLDPQDQQAKWMLETAQNQNIIYSQRRIEDNRDLWARKALLGVRGAMTPYDDPMVYPSADVWQGLTDRRKGAASGPPESPANQRTRELMGKQVPEIKFDAIEFEKALEFLRDLQRVNINPNWGAMEQIGITRNHPVTLQLRDVTFETALRELLAKVAGREDVLDYMIRDGVIKISTKDDLATLKYILVYDVRDLLHPLDDFRVPAVERDLGGDDDDDDAGGGGAGGGLFGGDDDDDAGGGGSEAANQSRTEKVTSFLTLVRSTVLPDSWTANEASVTEVDGLLVIKQTANGHREIAKLFEQLREHSRMQICIETRFLTIESSFLEDIGLDLDFIWHGDGNRSAIPMDVNTFPHGVLNPATGGFLDAAGATTLQPVGSADIFSVARSSLVVAGSFFDDLQVDFFLRATQAHQQSTRLNSLRVTLMNGHEAYILVQTQREYVSDLSSNVGDVAAYDPETSDLIKGVSFGVRATVTADRRYVIMTVFPTLRDDSLAGSFTFASGNQPGGAADDAAPGQQVIAQDVQIQLGEKAIQEVRTTVMVPDQGTLLLGGQRISDELEVETGVPILSKIPIVKRAFTTRSFVKRERTLLILIRPQILIPEELEPS